MARPIPPGKLAPRDIGLVPCTTPIQSPQSNGMAEAFVKLIKRDYARVSPKPELRGKDSELLGLVCYPERLCTQVSTVPTFISIWMIMATPAGFEPATSRLEGECSIQLSYGVS